MADILHDWLGDEPVGNRYRNRVWYPTGEYYIWWSSRNPDTTGVLFPGPGSFGDMEDFCCDKEEVTAGYHNRVYDSSAETLIWWETTTPDTTGASYPGPGTFGVNTSDFCITAPSRTVS